MKTQIPNPIAETYLFVMGWDFSGIGGVTQVVAGLYSEIERTSNLLPTLMVVSWPHRTPQFEVDTEGRRVMRMRLRPAFFEGPLWKDLLKFVLAAPRELWNLRSLTRNLGVRAINYHFIHSGAVTLALAKQLLFFRGTLIFSLHGLDLRTLTQMRGLRLALMRWALKRADAVIACSTDLAKEAERDLRLASGSVRTIHNGIDVERLRGAAPLNSARNSASYATFTFINLGTFEHKKGHDLLIRAFALAARSMPGLRLVIMGRDGPTRESTEKLALESGLSSNIVIRANVPHRDALIALADADAFVLPSRAEAFSVALLEAGAFGKPVVAALVSGVSELLIDDGFGLTVPPEDVEALACAMLKIAEDRGAARYMGERLRERIETHFTQQATTAHYLSLVSAKPR